MPQYQVHKLFPTPIFVHDDITTTEKQRDFVYAQKWYRPPADNGWLTQNHYLLDEPVMETLKNKRYVNKEGKKAFSTHVIDCTYPAGSGPDGMVQVSLCQGYINLPFFMSEYI